MKHWKRVWFCILGSAAVQHAACVPFSENTLDSSSGIGTLLSLMMLGPGRSEPLYIAGGGNCTVYRSTNGRIWTTGQVLPGCSGGAAVYALHYANGIFVAGGSLTAVSTGCGLWTSTDGSNWTQRTCNPGSTVRSLSFGIVSGAPVWVAGVTATGANQIYMTSSDAVTWTDRVGPGGAVPEFVQSLAFYNGTFVAGFTNQTVPSRSNDGGINWLTGTTSSLVVAAGTAPLVIATGDKVTAHGTSAAMIAMTHTTDGGMTYSAVYSGTGAANQHKGAAYNPAAQRLVLAGDGCSVRMALGTLVSFDPQTSMGSGCSAIDWKAAVYDSSLNQFVVAGNTNPGGQERFAVSPTGAIDTWAITASSANVNAINALALRPTGFGN